MSWMMSLNPLQKAAGILFLFAKVTNILAAIFIFSALVDKSYLKVGGFLTLTGFLLIMACVFLSFMSYQQEREEVDRKVDAIDEILADPEARKVLEERLRVRLPPLPLFIEPGE